ncbi:hypothetical protein F4801DRAFT_559288 [Xylaria longipes]|nr:hypothetical protein F4801DRAFT_559288 [Xylaria longipes]
MHPTPLLVDSGFLNSFTGSLPLAIATLDYWHLSTVETGNLSMLLHFLVRDLEGGQGSARFGEDDWRLVDHDLSTSDVEDVPFTCISYTWGAGREPSPFFSSFNISDRTIPAVNALVSHRPSCARIWVDAFCVPIATPERNHTLESMGYIYSQAKEVIVVLSSAARSVLAQMSTSDHIRTEHLDILEKEDWISRAWTYQEAVNSRCLFITCEGPDSAIVDGSHFLDCLGYTLSRLEGTASATYKRQQYPRLDAFEDLIADYMIAGFGERSALQVMANMDRRCAHFAQDLFYAMMGAISTAPSSFDGAVDPCEAFMSICERKGDYSFIYSTSKRDPSPGKRWRPASGGLLRSILSWHCFGAGQPAHEESGSLYLDQVIVFDVQPIEERGIGFIKHWLAVQKLGVTCSSQLEVSAHAALEVMGFIGSGNCLSTTHGFFFPAEMIVPDEGLTVLVATGVRWTFGAPGLACRGGGGGDAESYIPGIFFGQVDDAAATSVKIS